MSITTEQAKTGKFAGIVTHTGNAHMDDFLATAVLTARYPDKILVRTSEKAAMFPTFLARDDVYVVDIGREYKPNKLNFDHHQFGPGDGNVAPLCSLSLVLMHFKLYDLAKDLWPWLTRLEYCDVLGPLAAMREAGIPTEARLQHGFIAPTDEFLLNMFSKVHVITPEDTRAIVGVWRNIGVTLLSTLAIYPRLIRQLETLQPTIIPNTDIEIMNISVELASLAGDKFSCIFAWLRKYRPKVGIIITPDTRGAKYSLVRLDDHPMIDFNRAIPNSLLGYVHHNGFVAKMTRGDFTDALQICYKSCLSYK